MNSSCTPEFWDLYNSLARHLRSQADKAFELWSADPTHPSLHFKPLPGKTYIWSARISRSLRALCVKDGQSCEWFFIGSHEDYDLLIR